MGNAHPVPLQLTVALLGDPQSGKAELAARLVRLAGDGAAPAALSPDADGLARFRLPTAAGNVHVIDLPTDPQQLTAVIRGLSEADVAVVVVAAPAEANAVPTIPTDLLHVAVAQGVRQLVFAVNAAATPAFTQAQYEEVCRVANEAAQQVAASRPPLDTPLAVACVPVCAVTGANVLEAAGAWAWHAGGTLQQQLPRLRPQPRKKGAALRLPVVSLVPAENGGLPALVGRVQAGTLAVGATVRVLPADLPATVLSIVAGSDPVQAAEAGTAVEVRLDGVPEAALFCGAVLAKEALCPAQSSFDARIDLLPGRTLANGSVVTVHCHATAVPCELTVTGLLEADGSDPGRHERERAECTEAPVELPAVDDLAPGAKFVARLYPKRPWFVEPSRLGPRFSSLCVTHDGALVGVGVVESIPGPRTKEGLRRARNSEGQPWPLWS